MKILVFPLVTAATYTTEIYLNSPSSFPISLLSIPPRPAIPFYPPRSTTVVTEPRPDQTRESSRGGHPQQATATQPRCIPHKENQRLRAGMAAEQRRDATPGTTAATTLVAVVVASEEWGGWVGKGVGAVSVVVVVAEESGGTVDAKVRKQEQHV